MMDIQKEREAFEKHASKFFKTNEAFEDDGENYVYDEVKFMWDCWLAAKAQAVPSAQALHDRLLVKSIREHVESHIAEISVADLFDKGWFAAMKCIQNNIDMLEAQEPANEN